MELECHLTGQERPVTLTFNHTQHERKGKPRLSKIRVLKLPVPWPPSHNNVFKYKRLQRRSIIKIVIKQI